MIIYNLNADTIKDLVDITYKLISSVNQHSEAIFDTIIKTSVYNTEVSLYKPGDYIISILNNSNVLYSKFFKYNEHIKSSNYIIEVMKRYDIIVTDDELKGYLDSKFITKIVNTFENIRRMVSYNIGILSEDVFYTGTVDDTREFLDSLATISHKQYNDAFVHLFLRYINRYITIDDVTDTFENLLRIHNLCENEYNLWPVQYHLETSVINLVPATYKQLFESSHETLQNVIRVTTDIKNLVHRYILRLLGKSVIPDKFYFRIDQDAIENIEKLFNPEFNTGDTEHDIWAIHYHLTDLIIKNLVIVNQQWFEIDDLVNDSNSYLPTFETLWSDFGKIMTDTLPDLVEPYTLAYKTIHFLLSNNDTLYNKLEEKSDENI